MGKNYDDPLEFILDGEAESFSDGRCTGLTASTKLRKAWQAWTSVVNHELRVWGEHAEDSRGFLYDKAIEQLIRESRPAGVVDVAYDVYMTLDGAGVGMDDGRWFEYLGDDRQIDSLKKYLGGSRTGSSQGVLGDAFNRVKEAISDEAMRKCDRKSGAEGLDGASESFELVYSTGGHGGPHLSMRSAKQAAIKFMDGSRERWVAIIDARDITESHPGQRAVGTQAQGHNLAYHQSELRA